MEIKRIIEDQIKNALRIAGYILIVGPKWCGKTWISEKLSNSQIYLESNSLEEKESLGESYMSKILDGKYPRLIDEWQLVPEIWDKIRHIVDHSKDGQGLYILTGSTTVYDTSKIYHSGAGRVIEIKMSTLTFHEIINDNNKISLLDLFNKSNIDHVINKFDIHWVAKQIIMGGWPQVISKNIENSETLIENYFESIYRLNRIKDLPINLNNDILKNVLKSLARLNSSQLNLSTILSDLKNEIVIKTLNKYIDLLKSLFIIDFIEPWSGINPRSKYKIRTKPKMYFCDPSLGLSLLSLNHKNKLFLNLNNIKTFGIYFENQVIKDLKVYAQSINGKLYFYRDEKDFEIDAILELNDGRWAAIEIKLGDSLESIKKAEENLLKFQDRITTWENIDSKPSFLLIINNMDRSYKTTKGVYIIPHTCLKP